MMLQKGRPHLLLLLLPSKTLSGHLLHY